MNNCTLKRINKELKDFSDRNYYQTPIFSASINNFFDQLDLSLLVTLDQRLSDKITICQKKNSEIILELLIPDSYPFKPYQIINHNLKYENKLGANYYRSINIYNDPKYKIYNKDILKFFFIIYYQIEPKFLNLAKNDCFCCNSLTCPQNWNPSLRFNHVLIEYMELSFISKYNKPYSYLWLLNVYQQLFEKYFNKLPEDIINYIFHLIRIK